MQGVSLQRGVFSNRKKLNDKIIIGIDHGYGNIKTAGHCFRTGILSFDSEPIFTKDMLVYNGMYYLFGEGHKEFQALKTVDIRSVSRYNYNLRWEVYGNESPDDVG